MEKTGKSLLKSKMFWAAILEYVIGFLAYAQGELAMGHSLTLTGTLTFLLRLVTKEPIKF